MDGSGAMVEASDKRRWRIKRPDDHTRRDRTLLHAYVMIGAFAGLRPTEMYNLTWGDVLGYHAGRGKPVDQRDIRLQVRGKGKSGNRQNFTKEMINVLTTGAANLTNVDMNEEAANSQALATRQSLAVSSLSLASQASQGILQLLR